MRSVIKKYRFANFFTYIHEQIHCSFEVVCRRR